MTVRTRRPSIASLRDSLTDFIRDKVALLYGPEHEAAYLRTFKELSDPVFEREAAGHLYNSHFCMDGQPIELSLTFSPSAIDLRYGVDTSDPRLPLLERCAAYRAETDKMIPQAERHAALLDQLFDRHLRTWEDGQRFFVWHGVGFSRTVGSVGKLYFNTRGLSNTDLRDILNDVMDLQSGSALHAQLAGEHPIAFVCYDLTRDGLAAVKTYVLFEAVAFDVAYSAIHHPACTERLVELVTTLELDTRQPGLFFLTHAFSSNGSAKKVKFDIGLYSYGMHRFDTAYPLLIRAFRRWDMPSPPSRLFAGMIPFFEPTVLSIGASETSESAALYFKPCLLGCGPSLPCRH